MNQDSFVIRLNTILPTGFEAKKYNGLPRIHIKYDHYGFAVIDLKKDSYNLSVLEGMFSAIGVYNFERYPSMSNKTNRIKSIPYENTVILENLFKYVSDNPAAIESKAVQSY